ncbi:MAG: hypothetical protein DDG60_02890 [Anaerolineae bacterium]|nr:MAG: hypothetical protein DDG60_02890 [Anaerolineae bacterium]
MRKILTTLVVAILTIACSLATIPPDTLPIQPTATSGWIVEANVTQIPDTPLPVEPSPNPNDRCNNPYYPVVNGATWTYQIWLQQEAPTLETYSMSVLDDGTFTLTIQKAESVFAMDGACRDDGVILLDVPGVSATYADGSGSSTLSTTNDDGVTVPDDIQVGDEWSQTISVVASSEGAETLSATMEATYKALGYETVTVPAGTFYALKVEQNGSMTIHGSPPFDTHGFLWYAQGVGTVKSGLEGTYISELVSYSIP